MNRPTPIVDEEVYHVYNRGNNKQHIFHKDIDYWSFQKKLHEAASRYGVMILAFTLMPNHFHLLAIQTKGGSLPRMMESLETAHARRFNKRYGRVGHVFQGTYKSHHLSTDEALLVVARYIHLNPVRARLAKVPEDWPWSDYHQIPRESRIEDVFPQGLERRPPPSFPKRYVEFVRQGESDHEEVRGYLFGR